MDLIEKRILLSIFLLVVIDFVGDGDLKTLMMDLVTKKKQIESVFFPGFQERNKVTEF